MPKGKWAVGSVSDTARKRHERLTHAAKSGVMPKGQAKVGTGRSHEAQSVKDRQEYERIPEGNVRRKTGGK